jgi:uncharacterized membrane protein YdjX (TVP38/TMEM64 family)
MKKQWWGMAVSLAVCACVVGAWYAGFLPSFAEVQGSRDALRAYVDVHPYLSPFVFMLVYMGVVALSLPLATPLSLLAGYFFGALLGTFVVVVSATVGATVIFLIARYFFREFFEEKIRAYRGDVPNIGTFGDVLIARLVPAVPFSLINVLAGLTRVSLRSYVVATLLGIIPFSFVYVYAGERLGELQSIHDITSSESAMFLSRIALVLVVLYIVRRIYRACEKLTHS